MQRMRHQREPEASLLLSDPLATHVDTKLQAPIFSKTQIS